ncbi:hypothetical protein ACFX13_028708 [Malus domestica]
MESKMILVFSTLSVWFVPFLVIGLYSEACCAKCTSSCGNIQNISYPFRLKGDPINCGNSRYNLSCENNVTVLHQHSGNYYVQAINYSQSTIRVVDPGIQMNNCSSIPRYHLSIDEDIYYLFSTPVSFLKCADQVNSSLYVDAAPCINITPTGTTLPQQKTFGYVMIGWENASNFVVGCSIEWTSAINIPWYQDYPLQNASYEFLHNAMAYGFDLGYRSLTGYSCRGWNRFANCLPYTISGFFRYMARRFDVVFFLSRFILGVGVLIYKWRRRHLSMYTSIEHFLQSDNKFVPLRYSYNDIKRMTRGFKDKLGEGGYGSVFKGKLRSGRFGAIKMLGKPKANGQEFISEIATIGRIHHVNVVQLVGYCVEGSKRALVYDYMPNGSLEKYIYSKEGSIPINYQKAFEISLGVARGIKYLHEGCDMQILHFDIKPHNILLDENFIPKISDFGLAKLCPIDNSIVSLTAARGTMGYIAPELFYKNIGGVSFKADVYSFGMLLMEMASRRKNLNAFAEHSSQIYFPSWVYDRYNEGKDLEMGDITEEEKRIQKKMVITALWCIQMKPSDRPPMKKVIEMLEGGFEFLQMPPKPFLCPQEMPVIDLQDNTDPTCSTTELTSTLPAR